MSADYPHILKWDRYGRRGKACQILTPNTSSNKDIQIRFEDDGFTVVVPRQAVRRENPQKKLFVSGMK